MKLEARTAECDFSIRNLHSLKTLDFTISGGTIDEAIVTLFVNECPHIEELSLKANLSHFNLDSLFNVRKLSLDGTLNASSFNFKLFENLCNQLQDLMIGFYNIDNSILLHNLFNGYNFSNLVKLSLMFINSKILKKELINAFPILRELNVTNSKIEEIESDSFANLKHLCSLDLSQNQIKYLNGNTFSNLVKLEKLNLSENQIKSIDENAFSNLVKLEELNLSENLLEKLDPKFVGLSNSTKFTI